MVVERGAASNQIQGAQVLRRKAQTDESRRAARLGGVLASELSEQCTTSEMPFAAKVSPGLCASSRKDPTPSCELSDSCSQWLSLLIQLMLETHVLPMEN